MSKRTGTDQNSISSLLIKVPKEKDDTLFNNASAAIDCNMTDLSSESTDVKQPSKLKNEQINSPPTSSNFNEFTTDIGYF